MRESVSNRRDFLGYAGLAAAGALTGCASPGKTEAGAGPAAVAPPPMPQVETANSPPSERIAVGLIGCGGMGWGDLKSALRLEHVDCLAVCDVDGGHLANVQAEVEKLRGKKPDGYGDYRRLIERKDIDVVIIATPDHWHALPFVEACMAGKDIYCEKPIAHNIVEGRAMVNAAKKYNRVVQIGTQQRSGKHFQKAIEYVRSGKLGRIALTRTWNIDNDFRTLPLGNPPPADSDPPRELDFDFWLGPAPKRPYNEKHVHYNWRWFLDYGSGKCGDWNVHLHDIVHLAMGVDTPIAVSASGGTYVMLDKRETYDTLEVVYDYPGFTQVYSYRCTNTRPYNGRGYGIEFYGTDATLFLDREGFEVFPETYKESVDGVETTRSRVPAEKFGGSDQHWPHVQNFYECVKTRATPVSDIESMHKTTNVCHLGNIALLTGEKLFWNAEKEICVDKDGKRITAADRYLSREYRSPWKLPVI